MKLLAIAVVFCCASPAWADSRKAEAEAAYKQGQAQYMDEDYAAAAQSFKRAYAADPDPVYLFNIAQAFRLAKKCVEAGDYYRRFLRDVKNPPNEAAVKGYLEEVDDCARKAGQTPITEPVEPVDPPEPVADKPIDTTPVPSPPEDRGGGSKKRLAAYVVGGAGVVGVGLGFYFMKKVSDQEDAARAVCTPDQEMTGVCNWPPDGRERLADIEAKASTYEKLMATSFIAGGAMIATGVVLFVLGGDDRKESPVTISPNRGGATATYSIAF